MAKDTIGRDKAQSEPDMAERLELSDLPRFFTGKGYKLKSAKRKGSWGQAWGRPCASFQGPPGVTLEKLNCPRES